VASSGRIKPITCISKKGADTVISQQKETLIQANDLLNIQVYSRTLNQEQAAIQYTNNCKFSYTGLPGKPYGFH
jgi:hypothetical protein